MLHAKSAAQTACIGMPRVLLHRSSRR